MFGTSTSLWYARNLVPACGPRRTDLPDLTARQGCRALPAVGSIRKVDTMQGQTQPLELKRE